MAKISSGIRAKLSRAHGEDLGLMSSLRTMESKCRSLKTLPGKVSGFRSRVSDYGLQLKAKNMVRRIYGISERQFSNYFKKAVKQKGATGFNLIRMLEDRLDNVVYRLGFAATRAEARQLVCHKSVLVNGNIVNIPSYLLKTADIVAIRDSSKNQNRIQNALTLSEKGIMCDWLKRNENFSGLMLRSPNHEDLEDILDRYKIHLVVELYSK